MDWRKAQVKAALDSISFLSEEQRRFFEEQILQYAVGRPLESPVSGPDDKPPSSGSPALEVEKGVKPLFRERNDKLPDGSLRYPELAGKNVMEWLRLVWGPEMNAGLLDRRALRDIDRSAERAVQNWLRNDPLPAEIRLPTKKQVGEMRAVSQEDIRAAQRVLKAVQRKRRSPEL